MNVHIENKIEEKKVVLELGDVAVVHKSAYLIVKDSTGKYIARSFNGNTGSTGYHETLESLQHSLEKYNYTRYSQKEYELVLKPKQ